VPESLLPPLAPRRATEVRGRTLVETLGIAIPFTTVAAILAQTFVSAPFYIRAARAGYAGVDREAEDAARVDGAGEWSVFRHVTVPLAGALSPPDSS